MLTHNIQNEYKVIFQICVFNIHFIYNLIVFLNGFWQKIKTLSKINSVSFYVKFNLDKLYFTSKGYQ